MFLEILQTLIKVLMLFSMLIIAFGLSLHILLSKVRQPFVFPYSTDVLDAYFRNDARRTRFRRDVCATVLARRTVPAGAAFIILGLFMVLMPILLMNLLIGLAVGDIGACVETPSLEIGYAGTFSIMWSCTELERKLPTFILEKVGKKNELIEYQQQKCKLGFFDFIVRKWFCNPFSEE
ncbi:Transient receptor potential cation channel subfamily A member 1 [Eumeta japonica]|uniref:Transient receptor potential cation channel subfamily A member 1 n=1 Tax=Eumeta variegata TaxID=151549 RepID=A0A4C2A4Z0_EUMVA|nr:Transient receptor potential cation channel subfamily A member 1 [Eumeta japonica]